MRLGESWGIRHYRGRWNGVGCWLGAAEVFSRQSEVAFGSWDGFGEMFTDEGAGEAGPGGEGPSVDCVAPSVNDGAPCAQVEVGD